MKRELQIYGRLEEILNRLDPDRAEMLFVLGTLKSKIGLSAQEIQDLVSTSSRWNNYTRQKADEFLKLNPPLKYFFSSSKIKQVKEWRLNKGFVRTLASNEIALDLDTKEDFERAVRLFDKHQLKGNCRTWDGAKGGHVSLFFPEAVSVEFKEAIRIFFHGDEGQINITVEGKPHQRTGNIVGVIAELQGFNSKETIESMFKNEYGGITNENDDERRREVSKHKVSRT